MIQSLFTGKDISLRKEEKCASLSQAPVIESEKPVPGFLLALPL